MVQRPQKNTLYRFGPFQLDPLKRLLLREGEIVQLAPKVFDTLLVLVESSGSVVEKAKLMDMVWPDCFVEEINLTVNISALRKILGESLDEHKYIVTVPRRGYSFVADVREVSDHEISLLRNAPFEDEAGEPDERNEAGTIAPDVDKELTDQSSPLEHIEIVPPQAPSSRARFRRHLITLSVYIAVILVIVLGLWFLLSDRLSERQNLVIGKSIAVLPFKVLGSQDQEYLELGMADAVITRLSNLDQITVRPTSAILKYENLQNDHLVAGRELEVDTVLSGMVQRFGDEVRVTVQLVRVSDGVTVWAGEFERSFTDLFSVQEAIAKQVVGALMLRLTPTEDAQISKQYTHNSQAYQMYLKGRYYWNRRTAKGLDKAIECFSLAVEIDPQFALAFVGLADCYVLISDYGYTSPKRSYPKAKAAVTNALKIDDSLAEAHTSLAYILLFYDWDFAGAEQEFNRAIELNPNYATARHWYSLCLIVKGQISESRAEMDRALELDPVSLVINSALGIHFHYLRQYEQALKQYSKVLEMDPNFARAVNNMGLTYEQIGKYEEAIAALKRSDGILSAPSPALAHAFAASGKVTEARKILVELKELSKRSFVSPTRIAMIYTRLGEKDKAFEWLDKAFEERDGVLVYLNLEPRFDNLRADPRFVELVGRIGLPE